MIRKAVHSGTWYPDKKIEIERYLDLHVTKTEIIAGVCPHAGWIYSGKTAGKIYARIKSGDTFILIGPNHRGIGYPVSIMVEGEWETPVGNLEIDTEIANAILTECKVLQNDDRAHREEHSLEVQIPFIKLLFPQSQFVPICLADYSLPTVQSLGKSIAKVVKSVQMKKVVLIASSDMSHYESQTQAEKKDKVAIDGILAINPEGLIHTVTRNQITMCGVGPVAAMLYASKELGAKHTELIEYCTSGDVTGDYSAVVGYAGIIIK